VLPRWDGEALQLGDRRVSATAIRGFSERFGRWNGRAWLDVVTVDGALRIPIAPGYGALRAQLRVALADRPFHSDWADGRFPGAPAGLPPDLAMSLALVVAVMLAGTLAALAIGAGVAIWVAGAASAIAVGWPLARLRDEVVVRRDGLRIGPPWSSVTPWHEVRSIQAQRTGRRLRVWATTSEGGATATVPVVLLPALRARIRRMGGLDLVATPHGLDATYDGWRAPATGIPWGVLVGTAVAAPFTPHPWTALTAGVMSAAALACLAAAIEARATGWGAGAVLWSTGAYAVVLAALGLGLGAWIGGS
jgi:hypothetical protein